MKRFVYLTPLAGLVILAGCADNANGTNNTPGNTGSTGTATTPSGTTGTDTTGTGTGTGMGSGSGTDTGSGTGTSGSGASTTGSSSTTGSEPTATDKVGFATLGTNIKAALIGDNKTKGSAIGVDVTADSVRLTGNVASQAEKDEAEKVARKVMSDHKAGQNVQNDLNVGTASTRSGSSRG